MFGLWKKKPELETLAMAMASLGWNSPLGENEKNAVMSSGINLNVYSGEVTCLSLFSAIYAFSLWARENSFSEEQIKSVVNLFWGFVLQECQSLSMPEQMFELITKRINMYHSAQLRDEEAAAQNIISVELPRAFIHSIPGCANEPPIELMPGVSSRFHGTIEVTEQILNKLWKV